MMNNCQPLILLKITLAHISIEYIQLRQRQGVDHLNNYRT